MGRSVMDRIDAAQVQRDYAGLMAVVAIFDAAEDRAMAGFIVKHCVDGTCAWKHVREAGAVQGRIERARRAAVSEFQVYTWGREVVYV